MNEVSSKGCPAKGTTKCGVQEVTAEHSIDKTVMQQKKANMNGLVNGLTEEKPSAVKKQNRKNKKIGKRSSDTSSKEGVVNDDKIIVTENISDKQIVDSAINVKNNQKSNKNSKSRKSNLGSAVKKNNVNVSSIRNEVVLQSNKDEEPLQNALSENSSSNAHEIIPKNSSRCKKKDKSRKTNLISDGGDKQLDIEMSDFDITSIITKKMADICMKPPHQPKLKDGEPSCSKNADDIIDMSNTLQGLVLKEESVTTCTSKEVKSEEKNVETEEKEKNFPPVSYAQYESELQMPMIMKIIQKDLSEPYSIYTYRYFIHNWPNLCFLAMCEEQCVGAIVCKLDIHRKEIKRGYIAMLAVDKNYRNRGIGSTLVRRAIEEMIAGDADEVVLETEITNKPALRLYEALGFVRDKRLFRYYLNGVDALRLKLWLR